MPKPTHLDEDTWRRMVAYGGDPYVPCVHKYEVLKEWSSAEWTLAEFQEAVTKAVKAIPPEFRDTAKVEFEGGGYDESGRFEIYYTRPETAEEMEANAQRYLAYAQEQQTSERRTYERLKAKFESRS